MIDKSINRTKAVKKVMMPVFIDGASPTRTARTDPSGTDINGVMIKTAHLPHTGFIPKPNLFNISLAISPTAKERGKMTKAV